MSDINMLQYPIGEFLFDADVTVEKRNQYTTDYNTLPDDSLIQTFPASSGFR